jgi:steroid 5-alpha reductase family enzyme
MTLPFFPAVLVGWAFVAALMLALWFVQRVRQDAGVVDVGWAAGLGFLALFYAAVSGPEPPRRWLVAALAAAWAFRLAIYLLRDRVIGKEEDGRYRALRRHWGRHAQIGLLLFFQGQALADVVFSIPFLVAMRNPAPGFGAAHAAGVLVWLVAVAGESVADAQLARFRADPANRGRTCRAGLWGWSRHPNYFFEWLHWWSYVLLAAGSPWWWVNLFAPALMLYFLFKVTGIPTTEARALVTRGDDYRDYQRTVSAFVPLPPRRRGE